MASEGADVQRKVPVTVLTGFLGAGKTTLLNHILESPDHGLRFAIIENEFGDVGIDEKIISEKVDEEIIEVMNGCICCTVRSDLATSLKNLHTKVSQFDGVIIETTGLADPAPVAQTFFLNDEIQTLYQLDGVITVVDAVHILLRLQEKKADGVTNESVEQVAFADRILLNKIDVVTEEEKLSEIERQLRVINQNAPIIRCHHGQVDPLSLLQIGAFKLERVLEFDPQFLDTVEDDHGHNHDHEDHHHDHEDHHKSHGDEGKGGHKTVHDSGIVSCSTKFVGELSVVKLEQWIQTIVDSLGADLYRYKGVLAVKGMPQKFIFQGVGMMFQGGFSPVDWGPDEPRECRFVFIGKHLDKAALIDGFKKCQAADLRFKVGDLVEANVGGYVKAKVIRLWDSGNAYRVELEDGKQTNAFAPLDQDTFIRSPRSS